MGTARMVRLGRPRQLDDDDRRQVRTPPRAGERPPLPPQLRRGPHSPQGPDHPDLERRRAGDGRRRRHLDPQRRPAQRPQPRRRTRRTRHLLLKRTSGDGRFGGLDRRQVRRVAYSLHGSFTRAIAVASRRAGGLGSTRTSSTRDEKMGGALAGSGSGSVSGPRATAARLVGAVKTYGSGPGAVRALDGVDVAFGAGAFTAVMGPSGSGKSTLLHCGVG